MGGGGDWFKGLNSIMATTEIFERKMNAKYYEKTCVMSSSYDFTLLALAF